MNQRTILGHQHVASTDHSAAWQEDAQCSALTVGGVKAAFLADVPIQRDRGGALDQDGGQSAALGDQFVDGQHEGVINACDDKHKVYPEAAQRVSARLK